MTGVLDAVLFDAGGVLVLPDPTVLGTAARALWRYHRDRGSLSRPLRGDGGQVDGGRRRGVLGGV